MNVEVLASPGCHNCRAFEEWWATVARDWPQVTVAKKDITTPEGQELAQKYMIMASPGVVINGELFSTGGVDKEKFLAKLHALSSQN